MNKKTVVQFGAGNIGRGFLGHLYWQSGYEIVFIDINKVLIDNINRAGFYTLRLVGPKVFTDVKITNIRALHVDDKENVIKEISNTTLVSTAVGVDALQNISRLIAEGILEKTKKKRNSYLNIIICENLLHAGRVLKNYILNYYDTSYINKKEELTKFIDTNIGFVETVVSRMIPILPEEVKRDNPLLVLAEDYAVLPVNENGFVKEKEIPQIAGFRYEKNLDPYEEMKLFIHNLSHAMFAYLGYQKRYTYIWECVEDKDIFNIVNKAMYEESIPALIKKYNLNKNEVHNYMDDLLLRFKNKNLGDTVYRVARDPLRKLRPEDRLIGGAKLVLSQGIIPKYIISGIVSGLKYDYSEDESAKKLQEMVSKYGYEYVLREVCRLARDDILYTIILNSLRQENYL